MSVSFNGFSVLQWMVSWSAVLSFFLSPQYFLLLKAVASGTVYCCNHRQLWSWRMMSGDSRLHPAAPALGRSQPVGASLASGTFCLFSLCTENNAYIKQSVAIKGLLQTFQYS
jgi:hypothetical protein